MKIFLAFSHPGRDNNIKIQKYQKHNGIELLNLEKYTSQELEEYLKLNNIALEHLKDRISIPEINTLSRGITINYEYFGLEGYLDIAIKSFIELYIDSFIEPNFTCNNVGIRIFETGYLMDGYLSQININELELFFIKYKGLTNFLHRNRDTIFQRVKNNDTESFRFWTAVSLYQELRKYDNNKSSHFWEKEIMEIAIILETLFTESNEKESIGYTLKKRIHFLIGNDIEDIEEVIKIIYNTRSGFVHGSMFEKIKRIYSLNEQQDDINIDWNNGSFEITRRYISILRRILLKYYELHTKIKEGIFNNEFPKGKKIGVIDVIEKFMLKKYIQNLL